jgi:excisionase family DNA binding protein
LENQLSSLTPPSGIAPARGAIGNTKEIESTERNRRPLQEIITPSQVATLLQVHVKTVYRLAEQGVIPGHKIGRRWRFSRRRILDLVADSVPDGSTARNLRGSVQSPRS